MDAGRESTTAGVLLHTVIAQQIGLNATDTRALDLLARRGPMTAGELSTHTGLTSASVTSLVDRLERRELVKRQRDPADRRRVVVQALPEAGSAYAHLLMPFLGRIAQALEGYSDEELAGIARYLREAAVVAREAAVQVGAAKRRARTE